MPSGLHRNNRRHRRTRDWCAEEPHFAHRDLITPTGIGKSAGGSITRNGQPDSVGGKGGAERQIGGVVAQQKLTGHIHAIRIGDAVVSRKLDRERSRFCAVAQESPINELRKQITPAQAEDELGRRAAAGKVVRAVAACGPPMTTTFRHGQKAVCGRRLTQTRVGYQIGGHASIADVLVHGVLGDRYRLDEGGSMAVDGAGYHTDGGDQRE